MLKQLKGRVAFVFEQPHFDIDQIVGICNIKCKDVGYLAKIAMSQWDPEFAQKVRAGDVLIGAENFGYGHPHFQPMLAMRHLGISAVIAESFAPTYSLIETSNGFPQIPCPGILQSVRRWDEIEIDFGKNTVFNLTQGTTIAFPPLATADRRILEAGGIVPYLKEEMLRT